MWYIKILRINGRIYDRIILFNTLLCYFLNLSHFYRALIAENYAFS